MDTKPKAPSCEYDQNLDLLLKTDIFSKVPLERLRSYALLVKRMNYQVGEHVFNQGDFDNKAYLLIQGSLSISHSYMEKHSIHGAVSQGKVFGTLALIADTERLFSVQAVVPSTCLLLPRPKALSELDKDPENAKIFLKIITDRISHWEKNCLVEAATIESCPCKYGVSLI